MALALASKVGVADSGSTAARTGGVPPTTFPDLRFIPIGGPDRGEFKAGLKVNRETAEFRADVVAAGTTRRGTEWGAMASAWAKRDWSTGETDAGGFVGVRARW